MMRIAYVINSVEGGGAAAPVPAVAGLLQAHGAEVAVFALTGRDLLGLPAMRAAGIFTRICPAGEKDHVSALRWLRRELIAWKPDLIWTSLTRATLIGQIVGQHLRVPIVSWQHNAYLKPANRLLLRLRQARSALWVADSECVARLTSDRLAVPNERLLTWPLFCADPTAPRAAHWQAGQTIRIGSLGRLHRAKGYDVLIEAFASLKRGGFRAPVAIRVEIAGEGAERGALQARIDEAGLSTISLRGFVTNPRAFLAEQHLYVQPSRVEGLCIAVHEAMLAGLPAIASAVGEMPYSIEESVTGHTIPPGDPPRLAATLAMMLASPSKFASMGEAARTRMLDRFGGDSFAKAGGAVLARLTAAGIGADESLDRSAAPETSEKRVRPSA